MKLKGLRHCSVLILCGEMFSDGEKTLQLLCFSNGVCAPPTSRFDLMRLQQAMCDCTRARDPRCFLCTLRAVRTPELRAPERAASRRTVYAHWGAGLRSG